MWGFVVLLSGVVLVASGLARAWSRRSAAAILWSAGGAVFAVVALLLLVKGVEVLEYKYAGVVGSLYPALLSLAVVAARSRWWRYLALIYAVLILGIALGYAWGLEALRGASHGILHSISGLILVAGPAYYYLRLGASRWALLVSLGGFVISVGGVSLALSQAGVEAATRLVSIALYPVLSLSALLLAAGFYASNGLEGRRSG